MFNKIKGKYRKPLQVIVIFALVMSLIIIGAPITNDITSDTQTVGMGENLFTIGMSGVAYAAGTPDYACDGVQDNVQFQLAFDALPANGGKIVALAGNYSFAAAVTRAIDNITVEGMGRSTFISRDGVNPIFTIGVQSNYTFINLRLDAGGVNDALATHVVYENVDIGANYWAYDTSADIGGAEWDIPVARPATYVVAGVDASVNVVAQADYICDGTADNVQWQAALDAATTTGNKEKILGIGTFTMSAGLTAYSDVDVELIGELILNSNDTSATVSFNNITNSTWSGGTIKKQGTMAGLTNVITVGGASTDRTLVFKDIDIISEIIENATEQCGAVRITEGSPTFINVYFEGSATATGSAAHAVLIGGFDTTGAKFVGCEAIAGGGNSSSGFMIQDGAVPTLENCIGRGSSAANDQSGFTIWDSSAPNLLACTGYGGTGAGTNMFGFEIAGGSVRPTLTNCVGIGGLGTNNYGYYIGQAAAPIMTGCVGRPLQQSQWWSYDDADNGRFRPFAGHAYQLVTIYVYTWALQPGITLDIGTSIGGTEIASNLDLNVSNMISFSFTRRNVAANGYLYATPSGAILDDSLFIGYTVAYDTNGTKGLVLNTTGYASVEGSSFYGSNAGQGVYIAATSIATKNWMISNSHIENYDLDGPATALYAAAGITDAPIYNCVIHGTIGNITSIKGTNQSSSILPGEIKVASGDLTAGVANAFAFEWRTPERLPAIVLYVIVNVTTAGGTATSVLDVDVVAAAGQTGDTILDGIDLNATAVYDSRNPTDCGVNGTQKAHLLDQYLGANDFVTGKILVANAASLVGKYYIFYMGR